RPGGDQHLGDEEVAALEPRAHFFERRDQPLVEHHLRLHAFREALLGELLHGRGVPDERVLVEALEDFLVRHATPRFASWWSWSMSAESSAAWRTSSAPSSSRRAEDMRIVGPETLSAATASRSGPSTGAATAESPRSSASPAVA